MGEYIDQVPVEIQDHIRQITKTSGLPDTDDAVDLIAQGWLEKKHRFERDTFTDGAGGNRDTPEIRSAGLRRQDLLGLAPEHRAPARTGSHGPVRQHRAAQGHLRRRP